MGLVLRAVEVTGPRRWRWLLMDEYSGVSLAEHLVELDPRATETRAFEDLHRFLRSRADPDRRVAEEAELLHRVGTWIASVVLGERISRAIATAAPVTVRVVVPQGAEFLAARPLELAHVAGTPMAARGHVALVYDLPGAPGSRKAPVGEALRMLAVFSRPTPIVASELRHERYELSRVVRRVAARGRRRVELEVAQYGVTRAVLADLAQSKSGWDVLQLSGLDEAGSFQLENVDGSPDPVSPAELIELLYPLRWRLKLAVVSSAQPPTATTAQTLRWLGLTGPAAELDARVALEAGTATIGLAGELTTQLDCAVVAMRYPVAEEFAVGFAETLYNRLFRNTQRLDRAVAAAVPDAAGPAPSPGRPAISLATPAIVGASAITLSLTPPFGQPVPDLTEVAMAGFPPEPARFVGRAEVMAAAGTALAPDSGQSAVLLHGMVGVGKTTCALELAYRHQRAFGPKVFWSAPTDPDQFNDALRLLAVTLEAQLDGHGIAMLDNIVTLERLENFLPTLTTVLADAQLLLVLDNLDTLLTPDGQWRDLKWAPLISALTSQRGPARVIMTSRIVPGALNAGTVLVRTLEPLSRDESLLLARQLPYLRTLLNNDATRGRPEVAGPADPALSRRVLTRAQGHPMLLELADAAAADPARLAFQLDEVDAVVSGAPPAAFLTGGESGPDAEQLLETFTAWTAKSAATLPAPSRLLLQALCRIEETDRSTATLGVNWAAVWRRLGRTDEQVSLASAVAPLVAGALVAADPVERGADPNGPVRYRIHPGLADAVQAATPEPVTALIDTQLASWWTAIGDWGTKQQRDGKDTGQLVSQAGLTAARYLLRQHDWNAAICILDRTLLRDGYSPATSLAAIPLLRRIVEATGALTDLVVLGAALRKVDPGEAETILRRVYDQATSGGEYQLASTTAGDLVTLMRDQGRLREALTLAEQKIEHTRQAGFGSWTQLSDQGRWLQILSMLGHHEQVLTDLPGLRARIADLPDQRADNDRVHPPNVREGILDVGRCSAVALARWREALELGDEIAASRLERGAGPYEAARTRFHNYLPLLHLGRLADVDQLLRSCQAAFEAAGDTKQLAVVYGARADLEARHDHPQAAVDLQRTSLRLGYLRPEPREISTAHHNLADYLFRGCGISAEQRAHRLTAGLLNHLTGDTRELTRTLGVLAGEIRGGTSDPHAPVLPTTLREVTGLVDAGEGIRFGTLVVALCTDPTTAEHALADLLSTATTSANQPAGHAPLGTEHLLAAWAPIISTVGTAAANSESPPGLTDLLENIATTDWAALVAALRRILAGDRRRDLLVAGLDDIGAAVVTAILDQLSTTPQGG